MDSKRKQMCWWMPLGVPMGRRFTCRHYAALRAIWPGQKVVVLQNVSLFIESFNLFEIRLGLFMSLNN